MVPMHIWAPATIAMVLQYPTAMVLPYNQTAKDSQRASEPVDRPSCFCHTPVGTLPQCLYRDVLATIEVYPTPGR